MTQPKCLTPSMALLCKLGSLAVHVKEGISNKGHNFDFVAIEQILKDPELKAWITEMDKLALIPKER